MEPKRNPGGSAKGIPVDLNDPAEVMAILRGVSRELRRADQRIADAESRAVAAERELAGLSKARDELSSEVEETRRRAADAEAEGRRLQDKLGAVKARCAHFEQRLGEAQHTLARSRRTMGFALVSSIALVSVAAFSWRDLPPSPGPVAGPNQVQAERSLPQAEPAAPGPNLLGLGPPREVRSVRVLPRSRGGPTGADLTAPTPGPLAASQTNPSPAEQRR